MKNNFSEKNTIQQLKDKIDTLTETVSILKGSEQLLANAINDAPIGMVTLTVNGKFKTVNMAFCQITGYTEKELLFMKISQITHPNDIDIGNNVIEELISGKAKKANFEKRYINKNGNTIHAQVSTVILKDEFGAPQQFFTQVIDVTERKHAEEELINSEQKYRVLIESAPIGIYYNDLNGTFLYGNKKAEEIIGYKREQLIGQNFLKLKLLNTKDILKGAKLLALNVLGKSTGPDYFVLNRADSTQRQVEITTEVINISGKKVVRGIVQDITDRNRAEKKLKESERRLELAVEGAKLGLWDQDFSSGKIIRNERWAQMLGYELDEIDKSKLAWRELIHPDDLASSEKIIKEHEQGRSSIFSIEHRLRAKDGEWKWIHNWGRIVERDKNGRPLRALGVHLDITDRKRVEEQIEQKSMELKKQFKKSEGQRIATLSTLSDLNETTKKLQSEINERKRNEEELAAVNKNLEMFGETVSSMNECVSITDSAHKYIFVNKAWEKTYGYKKKEIIGKTSKIIQTEEQSGLRNDMRQKTKLGGWKGELTNKKKDGTIFPTELSITPLRDKKSKIIAQIGISSDITERKQAEKALKNSEDKLKLAQSVAKLGHYSLNVKTGNWISSDELDNIFGIDKKFKRDIDGWLRIIHPDFAETMSNYLQDNILKQHQAFDKEYKILNIKTQQEKWVHGLGELRFDENNNLIEMFGTIHDVTDRKITEEALMDSEIKYRKFFMEDLTGDYLITREGKIIDCNPQFLNIYGFKSLEQAQKYDATKLYKLQFEREKFIKRLEKNKVLLDEQSEQYKVNGEKIIIRENVSGEFDDDGKLINLRGYLYDITKRVKAEQEVVKLSTAIEQSPVSIMITDTDGIIEYVNPTFEKITGYSFDEAIGSKPSILKSGVNPGSEYSKLWKTITAGKVWIGEFLNKKKNGELYWESATISSILDNNNNITHFLAVKEDITKKKEIVGELMEREEKYRTLTQNLNVGVYRSTPGSNGRFVEVNPTFLKIFGFRSKNELERYKTVDFYSNTLERDRIEKKLTAKGFLINEETQLRKKDGTIFFASISSTSAKDELGKVIHHDGIIEDITERKEMMERILQERDRSQLYLDIAGVMFIALDKTGNVILANQKACEIIGTTEENLVGKNWFDDYIPKDKQLNTKDIFNNLMDGNVELAEFNENEILTTSGAKRIIAWQNSVLKNESGKIFGIVSSGLDITESKEDEELRNKLYETSRNLAESLNIDVVLHRMSKQARALLKCNGVTVYMIENDKKTLKPVVAYDPPYTKQVLATKIGIDNSLTGQAIKAKKGKIFNYHDDIKGAFHIKGTPQTDTDNIIVSPLEIDGEVIGALTLVRAKIPFTDKDLSIVNTFAVYGSTAIKNANIHKALLHEINERKKTEARLKESHDRYESIFNGTVDGIVYADWDGNIISVNSAAEKHLGIPRKKLIGNNAIKLVKSKMSGESLDRMLGFITNALKGDDIKDFLIKTSRTDFEFNTSLEKGKPGITVLIRDVTERNKAREDIVLHQKNLQSLSNELAMAEEKARRRLAITLHDKLGQSLVLANFKSSELNKKVKNSEHKKMLKEISGFLEDAINESRNITYELSPPVLYEMGLIPAISWKLDEIEKNNKIKTFLINRSKSYKIGKRDEIILYRSINELLQNVLKHSKAKSVNVSFRLLTNDYRITVSDNGMGFDLEAMKDKALSQKKFGLFSIMERIKYIGGRVEIDTTPKKGTKITIHIPIKN